MFQAQFAETIKKRFPPARKPLVADMDQFRQQYPKEYGQIHVDVNRSLFQFANCFRTKGLNVRHVQAIFERYFVDVYVNQTLERREKYFQGLTDVFELVFFSFVDLTQLSKFAGEIAVGDDKFETFMGKVNKFFTVPYLGAVSTGINVMEYIWRQSGFSLARLIDMGAEVAKAIRKHDPALAKFLSVIPARQQEISLLKYTISCSLHFSLTPEIGFLIGDAYLQSSVEEQVFIIQHLISFGARQLIAGLPHVPIISESQYQVMPGKLGLDEVAEEHAYFVLQESVPMMYRLDPALAGSLVSALREKYQKIVAQRTAAITIGTGVAVVAVSGLVGGILGALRK